MLDLALELERLEIRTLADEAGFQASMSILPVKGGKLAGFIAAQKKRPLRLPAVLTGNHFLQMAVNLQWRQYKKQLMDFTELVFDIVLQKKLPGEFKQVLGEFWEALGEEIAASEGIGPEGLEVIEAIALEDAAKARKAFEKTAMLASEYFAGTKMLGIGYKFSPLRPVGKHGKYEILEWNIKFDLEQADPVRAESLRSIYGGDEIKFFMSFTDKEMVFTMGNEARQRLEKALDGLAAKNASAPKALASAGGEYLARCGGFLFLSISRMMNMGMTMMKSGNAPKPAEMTSGLFIGGNTEGGRLNIFLRLPAEHLEEIGAAIKNMTGATAFQQPSKQ